VKKVVALYMWAVGLSQFVLFCLAAIVLSLFFSAQIYDSLLKRMLRNVFRLLFVPVRVQGVEQIVPGKVCIYMSNHVSVFDMPLLGGFIPGMVRSIEATRQFRWPLYGLAIRRVGNIAISRMNVFSAMQSYGFAHKVLKRGHSLVILPEGHRTLDGKLRPFKRLPFLFVKQAGVDLVPVGISGLFTLKNKNSWLIQPSKVKIRFGRVISSNQIDRLSESELRELTRRRIEELVEWI